MKGSFSFLKSLIIVGFFLILAMLWWSSLLIEQDVKQLTVQMQQITKQMQDLPSKIQRNQIVMAPKEKEKQNLLQSNSEYPNLLEEDPFYSNTLPQMLGAQFKPQGIRKEAMIGKPQNLHPFNGFAHIASMHQLCTAGVAKQHVGKYETMAPDMAIKLEKRSDGEYWVHLRDDLYWQPLNPTHFSDQLELAEHFFQRHPVTSHDFKFFYDAVMNPHLTEAKAMALRTYFEDIEEFRVVDDKTFIVKWKKHPIQADDGSVVYKTKYSAHHLTGSLQPLPRFVFQYFADGQKIVSEEEKEDCYRTHSIWAQNFTEHWAKNVIVSCGPWLFDGMTEEQICFVRNPDYYSPYEVLVERLIYTFKESPEHAWQDFKMGKIDTCFVTPALQVEFDHFLASNEYAKQKEKLGSIKELSYVDLAYFYLGWNQKKPFFKDVSIRQALTMAIDRNQIIQQNLHEMGVPVTGPFFCHSPAYDSSIKAWPYHPDQARHLLDQAGWIDLNGDGIRDQWIDGKMVPFRFTLIYYFKNHASKAIAETIQIQLREVGVDCKLHGLDLPDLSRKFDDKNFDALYLGWKLGTPPEDPMQLWHSSGASMKGSSNAIGFVNEKADQIMHGLSYEDQLKKRGELYHAFHGIIHETAPYTFLYSPKVKLVYRDYIENLWIPLERQDVIPGATIPEPDTRIIYINYEKLSP